MRRRLPLILVLALAPLTLAQQQQQPPSAAVAAPSDKPDQVSALIKQLSADDYATREDATQKLVQLGELALPRLQQLLPITTDGEARTRIQDAVDQITDGLVAGPSLITLDVTDADPKTVLAEISRQARATVTVQPEATLASLPKITFKCDHEPFWSALKRLCSPLGLQPDTLSTNGQPMGLMWRRNFGGGGFGGQPQPADHTVTLVKVAAGTWDKTPTCFAGPFMICVQRITQTGTVIPAANQRVHTAMIECSVHAEPKLTVVGHSSTANVTVPEPLNPAAAAAAGIPPGLVRAPFSSRAYYSPNAASTWGLIVPLTLPKGAPADSLPTLKGTANAKVTIRSESWELPDIARAAPRSWTAGGRTFTVKSVTRQQTGGDQITVIATATRKSERSMDPEEFAAFNSLELLDPNGRPLPVRARAQRASEDAATISFQVVFDATPEGAPVLPASTPLRLRWRLPLETKDLELPIDFTDLPLP